MTGGLKLLQMTVCSKTGASVGFKILRGTIPSGSGDEREVAVHRWKRSESFVVVSITPTTGPGKDFQDGLE